MKKKGKEDMLCIADTSEGNRGLIVVDMNISANLSQKSLRINMKISNSYVRGPCGK